MMGCPFSLSPTGVTGVEKRDDREWHEVSSFEVVESELGESGNSSGRENKFRTENRRRGRLAEVSYEKVGDVDRRCQSSVSSWASCETREYCDGDRGLGWTKSRDSAEGGLKNLWITDPRLESVVREVG